MLFYSLLYVLSWGVYWYDVDTMTSLFPLLLRHYSRYYDVTTLYYDVINPATKMSLTPLL